MHPDHVASVQSPAAGTEGRAGPETGCLEVRDWTPIHQLDEIIDISLYENKLRAIRAYRTNVP